MYGRRVKLTVNGEAREVDEGRTVLDLLTGLGLRATSVVVERNGEPLARDDFPRAVLGEGDVLEIVRPVQGGAPGPLDAARLYLVCGADFTPHLSGVLAAGVDVVQLRDKQAEAGPVVAAGEVFAGICARTGTPFVVNDRPDVALAVGAAGVHLGQDDLPPEVARRILGPRAVLGRSTHSRSDIDAACREHEAGLADYIAVGPVHATPTKPGRPAVGLELVSYAARHATMPWFAIGGLDATTLPAVRQAGASRIVVVRAITEAADPAAAAAALRGALDA